MATKTAQAEQPAAEWHNRIVRREMVSAADLLANPLNYRIHTREQREAIEAAIRVLGYVDPVTVQDGTNLIVDGHLRVETALSQGVKEIPVDYVDLSDEEVAFALLTMDPIAAMARTEQELFDQVRQLVDAEDQAIIDAIAHHQALSDWLESGMTDDVPETPEEQLAQENEPVPAPERGHLLGLMDVTMGEPRHECHLGEVYRLSDRHTLAVVHPFTGWPVYTPYLTQGAYLIALAGPLVPHAARADEYPFVMVQPNLFTAGHILDRWEDVHGDGSTLMVASDE